MSSSFGGDERENLLEDVKNTMQKVIQTGISKGAVYDWHDGVDEFTSCIEVTLFHGLREISTMRGPSTLMNLLECLPQFEASASTYIEVVKNLSDVKTQEGMARAWIRVALNEKFLADSIETIAQQPSVIEKWYFEDALLRDPDDVSILISLLRSLDGVDFSLSLNNDRLDRATILSKNTKTKKKKKKRNRRKRVIAVDDIPDVQQDEVNRREEQMIDSVTEHSELPNELVLSKVTDSKEDIHSIDDNIKSDDSLDDIMNITSTTDKYTSELNLHNKEDTEHPKRSEKYGDSLIMTSLSSSFDEYEINGHKTQNIERKQQEYKKTSDRFLSVSEGKYNSDNMFILPDDNDDLTLTSFRMKEDKTVDNEGGEYLSDIIAGMGQDVDNIVSSSSSSSSSSSTTITTTTQDTKATSSSYIVGNHVKESEQSSVLSSSSSPSTKPSIYASISPPLASIMNTQSSTDSDDTGEDNVDTTSPNKPVHVISPSPWKIDEEVSYKHENDEKETFTAIAMLNHDSKEGNHILSDTNQSTNVYTVPSSTSMLQYTGSSPTKPIQYDDKSSILIHDEDKPFTSSQYDKPSTLSYDKLSIEENKFTNHEEENHHDGHVVDSDKVQVERSSTSSEDDHSLQAHTSTNTIHNVTSTSNIKYSNVIPIDETVSTTATTTTTPLSENTHATAELRKRDETILALQQRLQAIELQLQTKSTENEKKREHIEFKKKGEYSSSSSSSSSSSKESPDSGQRIYNEDTSVPDTIQEYNVVDVKDVKDIMDIKDMNIIGSDMDPLTHDSYSISSEKRKINVTTNNTDTQKKEKNEEGVISTGEIIPSSSFLDRPIHPSSSPTTIAATTTTTTTTHTQYEVPIRSISKHISTSSSSSRTHSPIPSDNGNSDGSNVLSSSIHRHSNIPSTGSMSSESISLVFRKTAVNVDSDTTSGTSYSRAIDDNGRVGYDIKGTNGIQTHVGRRGQSMNPNHLQLLLSTKVELDSTWSKAPEKALSPAFTKRSVARERVGNSGIANNSERKSGVPDSSSSSSSSNSVMNNNRRDGQVVDLHSRYDNEKPSISTQATLSSGSSSEISAPLSEVSVIVPEDGKDLFASSFLVPFSSDERKREDSLWSPGGTTVAKRYQRKVEEEPDLFAGPGIGEHSTPSSEIDDFVIVGRGDSRSEEQAIKEALTWSPLKKQVYFNVQVKTSVKLQNNLCAGCGTPFDQGFWRSKPRYCEYTGKFFCKNCHHNDTGIIPARVLQQWDWTHYPLSDFSKKFLFEIYDTPAFNVAVINPDLYRKADRLLNLLSLREQLYYMKDFILTCRERDKLMRPLAEHGRQHLVYDVHIYSIRDLMDLQSGELQKFLMWLAKRFLQHIIKCELCRAKGSYCEICLDKSSKPIYSFQLNTTVTCKTCHALYHKKCYTMHCPKCERIKQRKYKQRIMDNSVLS